MQAIQTIYDDNHQIYGAPKIAKEMQKKGDKILVLRQEKGLIK